VGIVTVCAGHTRTAKLGQKLTEAECEALLKEDVKHAEKAVKRLVKVPLTQNQFDAVVSFVFNVGEGRFASSTLLKKINRYDCWGAGAEFSRWVYGGDKVLPGLVKRRADERKAWESGCATGNYKVKATQASPAPLYAAVWKQARRPEYAATSLLALPAKH
jgi:lysozyme